MPATILAVDPDVWRASASDLRCRLAISEIWEDPDSRDKYVIALDGDGLESEYYELMMDHAIQPEVKKILQDIINQRFRCSRVRCVTPYLSAALNTFIIQHQCDTPIEPALIAMAASRDTPAVTLLLVGSDNVRRRGLHQPDVKRSLRSLFKKEVKKAFAVKAATDYSLLRDDKALHKMHSRAFEDQIRAIIQQRIGRKYGRMPYLERITPTEIMDYQCSDGGCSGEVDVYLYLDFPDHQFVWIGECELREEGNEGVYTDTDKVRKLVRKIEGVRNFETGRCRTPVIVKGYLITNANSVETAAQRALASESLTFVHAKMPLGWTGNFNWQLHDTEVERCDL